MRGQQSTGWFMRWAIVGSPVALLIGIIDSILPMPESVFLTLVLVSLAPIIVIGAVAALGLPMLFVAGCLTVRHPGARLTMLALAALFTGTYVPPAAGFSWPWAGAAAMTLCVTWLVTDLVRPAWPEGGMLARIGFTQRPRG